MARYVVDAVLLEGRSVREVARAHGISKTWIYELIARYRSGGYEALEPRSRRPRCCPHETSAELVSAIVGPRGELEAQGHDAGAETIAYHLAQTPQRGPLPSRRSGAFSGARDWFSTSPRSARAAR
jgi:transposase-like protein